MTRQLWLTYLVATAALALAFVLQFFWVKQVDNKSRLKLRAGDATHAGGIVYRLQNDTPEYFWLAQRKKWPASGYFPRDTSMVSRNRRRRPRTKMREETGVLARVVCLAGRNEFRVGDEKVVAKYYLMESFFMTKPEELGVAPGLHMKMLLHRSRTARTSICHRKLRENGARIRMRSDSQNQPGRQQKTLTTILNDIETRVLGSLVEKQVTTPEYYPLTLNALTLACNQKNNRSPGQTSFSEDTVAQALETLREKNLAYVFYGSTSRVPKYKHVLPEVMHLSAF